MLAHAEALAQLTDAQRRAIPAKIHDNTIHSFDSNLTIPLGAGLAYSLNGLLTKPRQGYVQAGPEEEDMRRFRYLAAAMAITGLLAGSATAASAATSQPARAQAAAAVHLRSGATAVTTAPGVAAALLANGIVPLATWPGSQSVQSPASGPAVRFTFRVTGAGSPSARSAA